ncbi:hypothetical protein [Pedobacter terrae]|uniref:hypothetical protein n=1 Tax=Pedobacter terrae TaxID=405671 RepID=UPI002FFC5F26
MKVIVLIFCAFLCRSINAQTLYVDPVTAAAMAGHSGIINRQLDRTNNNLSLISRGQLLITGQLVVVNDMQDRIYRGLTEVSAILNNLMSVKEITDIGLDIVRDVEKAVEIGKSNPVLLLFAEQNAREFKTRAVRLGSEVGAFVLRGGRDNLMDAGERSKLLNHIASEMRILRGTSYGMHRAMYWAKMRGIFASLNPWSGWVNMDVRIANEILSGAKYLKK